MMHIGEAKGQRGLAHIGEHVAEERFMFGLSCTEPRLCDQIAEVLRGAECVRAIIEQGADLLLDHFECDVVTDQVMPYEQREPAS
ncbi:hypothetical protein AWB76_07837 [Caballeronia temeraria]|uniref:Uncharacterized protein n=1 Tax=Caballeronia temeraria TaxID=1777137 RepID=A0A158E0C0_9BURK|nr:hypothetical protein AWB76_07837 [Caballeronia temeraria]